MAIPQLAKQSGDQPISDPLQKLIISLIDAMRADFGVAFQKQFSDPENLRQYKRRLYQKLRERDHRDVLDGYEVYVDSAPKFPPKIPELLGLFSDAEKRRLLAEKNASEAQNVTALPPPVTHECDPVAMLVEAKEAATGNGANRDERLKAHEALINIHRGGGKIKARPDVSAHKCEHGMCHRAGTISSTTTGGGNFYCAEHFRAA